MKAICECGHEEDWHRLAPSKRVCQHKGCDCPALKLDAERSVVVALAETEWQKYAIEHDLVTANLAASSHRRAFVAGFLAAEDRDDD